MQSQFVVGTKQTLKAIEQREALKVYLAYDASCDIREKIVCIAKKHSIPIVDVSTMEVLGRTCGINRKAASACIVKKGGE